MGKERIWGAIERVFPKVGERRLSLKLIKQEQLRLTKVWRMFLANQNPSVEFPNYAVTVGNDYLMSAFVEAEVSGRMVSGRAESPRFLPTGSKTLEDFIALDSYKREIQIPSDILIFPIDWDLWHKKFEQAKYPIHEAQNDWYVEARGIKGIPVNFWIMIPPK